jgi:hypothetical protein
LSQANYDRGHDSRDPAQRLGACLSPASPAEFGTDRRKTAADSSLFAVRMGAGVRQRAHQIGSAVGERALAPGGGDLGLHTVAQRVFRLARGGCSSLEQSQQTIGGGVMTAPDSKSGRPTGSGAPPLSATGPIDTTTRRAGAQSLS